MFASKRFGSARRALVEMEVDSKVLNLDDAKALLPRALRPSNIATPDRTVTQRLALAAFEEQAWDGLSWWSVRDARWSVYGLWSANPVVVAIEPLTLRHPAALEAAEMLGRA